MKEKQQLEKDQSPVISPLAKDVTYGERVHSGIFNFGINFLSNLLLSAGFSYWVNHSQTPVKLFGRQFSRPSEVQTTIAKFIETKPFMKVFGALGESATRTEAAKVMSGVLTLTAAGHLIMIPSVWLGAKLKAPMVEWLNRRHYGDAAMDDPSLKARHHAIRTEDRPTLFGSVIGRFGTILATQFTGYTIGSQSNAVKWAAKRLGVKALQEFKGIDHFTEFAGDKFGSVISEMLPAQTAKWNEAMVTKRNFGWSVKQLEDATFLNGPHYGTLANGKTSGVNEHFGKYVVSDILYTIVTALSISPAINFIKRFIPGVTYKPKVATDVSPAQAEDALKIHVQPNPVAQTLHDEAAAKEQRPEAKISHAAHQSRLQDATQNMGVGA